MKKILSRHLRWHLILRRPATTSHFVTAWLLLAHVFAAVACGTTAGAGVDAAVSGDAALSADAAVSGDAALSVDAGDTTPLRDLTPLGVFGVGAAARADIIVQTGTPGDPSSYCISGEARYCETLAAQFDFIVPENAFKWSAVQWSLANAADYTDTDRMVRFAADNGMGVKGHTLMWSKESFFPTEFATDPAAVLAAACDHITGLVARYAPGSANGEVFAWDVWNEAVLEGPMVGDATDYSTCPDAAGSTTAWLKGGVPVATIAEAFACARAANPSAILLYNDFGGEQPDQAKSKGIYCLVRRLVESGAPVDAVGFQTHVDLNENPVTRAQMAETFLRFQELGVDVVVSELDVRIHSAPGSLEERLAAQAVVYGDVAGACVASPACRMLSTWGFTDAHTWITNRDGVVDYPLPFDAEYQPKPAFFAMAGALSNLAQSAYARRAAGRLPTRFPRAASHGRSSSRPNISAHSSINER